MMLYRCTFPASVKVRGMPNTCPFTSEMMVRKIHIEMMVRNIHIGMDGCGVWLNEWMDN